MLPSFSGLKTDCSRAFYINPSFLTSKIVSNIVGGLPKGEVRDGPKARSTESAGARRACAASGDDRRRTARRADEWRMAPDRRRRRQHEGFAAGSNQRPERQEPQDCVDMEGGQL